MRVDANFGFAVPLEVPGVDAELMTPQVSKEQAEKLANLFRNNWRTKFPEVQCEGFGVSRAALVAIDSSPKASASPSSTSRLAVQIPVGGKSTKSTRVVSRGLATVADLAERA